MSRRRLVRGGGRLVLVALVLCATLLAASVASAATSTGVAVWSSATPADGSATSNTRPTISVQVRDTQPIFGNPYYYMKVDGLTVSGTTITYQSLPGGGVDQTRATISYTPKTALKQGSHTVLVRVRSSNGISEYTWKFDVANPPVLASQAPAAGGTASSVTPAISATVTQGAVGIVPRVWIDGAEVPASYDSVNARVSATPAEPLANDTSHTAKITVTNSYGLSVTLEWTFNVQIYPAMSGVSTCWACHTTMPNAHPMTDCAKCHDDGAPFDWVGPQDGADPNYHATTPRSVYLADCGYCHSGAYPAIYSHPFTPDSYHVNSTSCSSCHVKSLSVEHNRYGLTCLTCHQSTDPLVQNAIATGNITCLSCHENADHESLHTISMTAKCAGCHSSGQEASSLTRVHMIENDVTCEDCHDSTAENVQAAISGHNRDCAACHTVHDLEVTFCYGCHESNLGTYDGKATAENMPHMSGTASTKALNVYPGSDASAGACVNCHPSHSSQTRAEGNQLCAGCHDAASNVLPATYSYQGQSGFSASSHGGVAADGRTKLLRSDSASFAAFESATMPTPASPGTPVPASRLSATMAEDAARLVTKLSNTNGGFDYQTYRFKLPVDAGSVDEIVPRWSGFGEEEAGYPVALSLWNETLNGGSGGWERLFEGDTPLQAAVKGKRTSVANYADADGFVWLMASAKNLVDSTISAAPSVGTNTATAASLSWKTLGPTDTRIDYGVTSAYGQVFQDASRMKTHNVTLGMLSAGVYHYKITSTSRDGDSYVSPDMTFGLPSSSLTPVPDVDVTGVGYANTTLQWSQPYAGAAPFVYTVTLRDWSGAIVASRTVIGTNSTSFTLPANYYQWTVTATGADGTPFGTSTVDDFYVFESSGSCPFVFTYDGEGYAFEADNFTAGRLGGPTATGYQLPNPNDAYVLKHTPAEVDGKLSFKVVEERREVDYLDAYRLYAVDAPAGTQVFAEKAVAGTTAFPPLDDALHTVRALRAPVSAVRTDTGADVLSAITTQDGASVVLNDSAETDFTYKTLELDFGAEAATAPQFKVVMDAVSEFPVTPEGIARRFTFGAPTKLEVQQADGSWLSIPRSTAGLPAAPEFVRPYVFDLTSAMRNSTGKARFTFLFKTHIDYLAFDTTVDEPLTISEVPVASATLGYHGVDEMTGFAADSAYVYDSIVGAGVLNEGAYTRYGDVAELLAQTDDKFVIMGQGDELTLEYTAPAAPSQGIERRFIFSANGYYKDAKTDLPQTVEPLPFAGMSNYPYPSTESYPTDAEHEEYRATYNTRVVAAPQVSAAPAPSLADTVASAVADALDAVSDAVVAWFAPADAPKVAAAEGTQVALGDAEVAWSEAVAGPEGLHHSLNTDYLALEITYRSGSVAAGSCAGCHAVHGSTDSVNGGALDSALVQREDRLCTGDGRGGCHDAASNSANGVDIAAKFTASTNRLTRHDITEDDQRASGAKLACSGCHDPHTNTATSRYSDPDQIGTSLANTARNNYVGLDGKAYMLVGAAHDGVPPLITGDVLDSSISGHLSPTVTWTTNEKATTWVEWGTTTAYGNTNGNNVLSTSHSTTLQGLTVGTTYNYRVYSLDALGNRSNGPNRTYTPLVPPEAPVPVPVADYTGDTGPFPFTLRWSAVSPTFGTLVDYQAEVRTTSGQLIAQSGWMRSTLQWTPWLGDGTYRWTVRARNATQVTAVSMWSAYDEFVCTELYPWTGSCPFLFTNDGSGFAFESDNFTAGRIGGPTATGYQLANPNDAYLLKNTPASVDGHLEFRLVEERREVDYLDSYRLYTVDAPAGTQVFAEKAVAGTKDFPPLAEALHTVRDLRAPLSAVRTDTGADALAAIAAQDGSSLVLNDNAETDFTYKTLELDFGAEAASAPQFKVVMDAVTEFPVTPEGIARRFTFGAPTKLEVQQADGTWVAVPKTTGAVPAAPEFVRPYVFDLTRAVAGSTGKVRFTFLFKTHIDYLAFDTSVDEDLTITEVPVASATLQHHGVDEMIGEAGTTEYVYDSLVGAGVLNEGAYTRYGEVKELLTSADDKFVIMGQGDELALRYTAPAPAGEGVERRFVFSAKGYYKDAKTDLPQTVEPLPFDAMSNYPYPSTESYPTDAEHEEYRATYNTRVVEARQVSAAEEPTLLDTIASAIGDFFEAARDAVVAWIAPADDAVQVAAADVEKPVHYSVNTDLATMRVLDNAGAASTVAPAAGWVTAGVTAPTPSAPGTAVGTSEIAKTATQDGTYLITDLATADQSWNWQVLAFDVGDGADISQLRPKWIGHGEPTPGYFTEVKVWNFRTSQWESIGRTQAPTDATYLTNRDASDNAFCLKCHDGSAPAGTTVPSTLKNIASSWGPGGDAHGAYLGTGTGALAEGYKHGIPALGCSTCHDSHGSSNLYHIPTTVNGKSVTVTTKNTKELCLACHEGSVAGWHGECAGCHVGGWVDHVYLDRIDESRDCSACHGHSRQFQHPASCHCGPGATGKTF